MENSEDSLGAAIPAPYTPADCDLTDFPRMPMEIARLFGSGFHARSDDSTWRAGVTLWLKAFQQVPAGSLPTDDEGLARLAEMGRDLKGWRKLREGALYGWVKCSDGRLYHKVVAELVLEAWLEKLAGRIRGGRGNKSRWGSGFDEVGLLGQFSHAVELLRAVAPLSRALDKKRGISVDLLPPGGPARNPGDSRARTSRDSSGDPTMTPTRTPARTPTRTPTRTPSAIPQGFLEGSQGKGRDLSPLAPLPPSAVDNSADPSGSGVGVGQASAAAVEGLAALELVRNSVLKVAM
jgi:hypothetical protein